MLRVLTVACLWITAAAALQAEVDYPRDIKPLLATKCLACHGPVRQEAGLRLDAGQFVRQGSQHGPVAIPRDPGASLLLKRVTADDPEERMPPVSEGEPLTAEQVAQLREWIAAGLPSPPDETFLPSVQDHWAYRPIRRPPLPPDESAGDAAVDHPIDRFLSRHHRERGLQPLPPAEPLTLLRRVTFDLIGLPPTPAEQEAFLRDSSPAAYERLVETLLARPQFGERWGRHWMDVWRYSDWDGYKDELRGSQRHIWRWRDWIVESLNAGKPYDRMIVEMLAGDELAPDDPETLRATGFLARNYHNSNRNIWLDATVEHTAKGFLGLTLNCARCHDHKYDPLSQNDYYAFRAIFEPHQVRTDRLPGQPDLRQDGLPRAYDADLAAPTYLYRRGDEKQPDKEHPIPPGVPRLFDLPFEIQPVTLPPIARFPALAEFWEREELAAAEERVRQRREERQSLEKQFAAPAPGASPSPRVAWKDRPPGPSLALRVIPELEAAARRLRAEELALESLRLRWRADRVRYNRPGPPADADDAEWSRLAAAAADAERAHAVAVAERDLLAAILKYRAVFQTQHNSPAQRTDAIQKGLAEITKAEEALAKAREGLKRSDPTYTPVGPSYPATSSGRRLALARWIVHPQHPLTARVAVNQVWMRHFGRPLVVNVDDFGLRTPAPPLVDLLDWLAAEFIDSGWDLKHLHRLIVTSAAYRRASTAETALVAHNRGIDPENRCWWRADVRRLEAEVIRDSLLAVGGRLDQTLGGPDLSFTQGETIPRRSLYFQHAYEKQMTWLVLFDAPSPTECYRRSASIVPQQALALSNSNLSRSMARACVQSGVGTLGEDDRTFIEASFRRVLGRPPEEREVEACLAFLARQRTLLADQSSLHSPGGTAKATVAASPDPALRAREDLIHVLMNHNDFVTVR